MEVWIEGRRAALKQGTSFEYVVENRLFTDADSYTMSIVFPLRGCMENIRIFGRLNRSDVLKEKVVFDCELRDRSFCKSGVLTVVGIEDGELKGQFLEGRSAQNFADDFDEVFINELDLGSWPGNVQQTPAEHWGNIDDGFSFVSLPWVNAGSGVLQNGVTYADGCYAWAQGIGQGTSSGSGPRAGASGVSWQPYLLYIAKKVCDALGYSYDFSPWESSRQRFLLVCNTLPAAWGVTAFARALPHWSVTQFFSELEKLLVGEIDINHRLQRVTFRFTSSVQASTVPVCICEVIDECRVELSESGDVAYRGSANRRYADGGHQLQNYYSCEWFIRSRGASARYYANIRSLLMAAASYATPGSTSTVRLTNSLLYVEDIRRYFVLRIIDKVEGEYSESRGQQMYNSVYLLQPVNVFGEQVIKEDNDNVIELNMVPACIDYTDAEHGLALFLDPSSYGEEDGSDTTRSTDNADIVQPAVAAAIEKGPSESRSEYYDRIFVACWDGQLPVEGQPPFPAVYADMVGLDFSHITSDASLSFGSLPYAHAIDPKVRYTFQFLASEVPDVRSLYYIQGQRYLCEKITAVFDENGMSKRLKGDFFRVL